jgi:hypothetical protein
MTVKNTIFTAISAASTAVFFLGENVVQYPLPPR